MFLQNQKQVVPGVGGLVCAAAVNEDGPLTRSGDLQLADQPGTLHVARRAFVVVVEADFSAGDDLGLGQQGVEFGQDVVIGFSGVVGIDSCACVEPGEVRAPVELAAKVQGLLHFGRPFADADGEHCAHACFARADKHGFTVAGVAMAVQVRVRVDQQANLAGCMGNRRATGLV